MSRAADLALLLAQAPAGQCALLRGKVVSWDATGYIIRVMGVELPDVPVLAQAGTLTEGDVVAVLRQSSSYLVLGKITAPGG